VPRYSRFHTVSFMTCAVALYERLGYRRAPEFDFDWAARFGRSGAAPITAIAFLRHLTWMRADVDGVRHPRCTAESVHPKPRIPPMTKTSAMTIHNPHSTDQRARLLPWAVQRSSG